MTFKNSLKSKDLLLVAPHFRTFIGDQVSSINPFFNKTAGLLPIPRFSRLLGWLPFLNQHFSFLESAEASHEKPPSDITLLSAKFFTLPIEILRRRNSYFASKSCVKVLLKSCVNFDLIHSHFLGICGFVGSEVKHLTNKPLILTVHGSDVYDLPFRNDWYNNLARYVLGCADKIITVSKSNEVRLRSLGVPPRKLHIIHNGFDDRLFRPTMMKDPRRKLGIPPKNKILLSVGNLVNAKGHIYLIRAMENILRNHKDVTLIIVGSGPLMLQLKKTVHRLGLEGSVLFVGRQLHEIIPVWMNACDLFVLPSLSEGFPTVIPEAMACGKPIVGTTVGGVPEVLSHEDLGISVKPKDSMALASAVSTALDKKWDQKIILDNAKQFSWGNITHQILKVYSKALWN